MQVCGICKAIRTDRVALHVLPDILRMGRCTRLPEGLALEWADPVEWLPQVQLQSCYDGLFVQQPPGMCYNSRIWVMNGVFLMIPVHMVEQPDPLETIPGSQEALMNDQSIG